MNFVAPTIAALALLPAAAVLFLLPGWVAARRWGSASPLLSAFLFSAALLFNLVLLLDALHLPLHAGVVGLGLALTTVLLWRRSPASPATAAAPSPIAPVPSPAPIWLDRLLLLAPAFALLSIGARALLDPLSGYDTGFRWDYLGRLVWAHGSLHGYPPVSAADFEYYAWCDGIPPLVPLLNFWIYAVTDSIAPSLTALRVVAEAGLLGLAVYRYSELLWGRRSGGFALAALSGSALALWSVAMGQETGLTALSLVAMLYFLERHQRASGGPDLSWAAVAGGVAALARDYTLAFPLLGLVILLVRRSGLRPILRFAGIGAAIAAPWYVRNWILTGNPLYPQRLGGLFPGNAVHDEVMRAIVRYWSPLTSPFSSSFIPVFLSALAGLLALAAVTAFFIDRSRLRAAGAGIALATLLWAASLPETAGGWIYSARVLLPALALLAVLAGSLVHTRPLLCRIAILLFIAASADAARRSWLLPEEPLAAPWSTSFEGWRQMNRTKALITNDRVWAVLAREAGGAGIVVDHPANHALLTLQGATAVPLFSPVLAPAFDDRAAFPDTLAALKRAHIRFVALTLPSYITQRIIHAHPFWNTLCTRYRPNATVGILSIFDLDHLEEVSR